MSNIFDPMNLWLGRAPLAFAPGNKLPVTVDDTVSVAKDNGPITVDVLANDFDPEGQPLTLLSAFASLGTAVAEPDNTVTYTPPPGITGFDTVIYVIQDDLGQQREGQIDVTITGLELSITTQADNTLVVNTETGLIDITVTTPSVFAGTYQANTSDLIGGPFNLVAPVISGTEAVGETLIADAGLWIYDTGSGQLTQTWQWRRGSVDITGENAATYTIQASDIGPGLSVREILSDAFGTRFSDSNSVATSFTPTSDTALLSWWDADDPASITTSSGMVSAWADKAGNTDLTQPYVPEQPSTGTRTLNGRNVINFDGTQILLANGMALPATGNMAFHAVMITDTTANAFEALLSVEATNDFQIDANNAVQFDGRLNAAGIGSSVNLSGGPYSGAFILSLVFDHTGAASAEVYIANQLRGSMVYTTPIDSSVALHLMSNRSRNANVDGAVAELIITGDVSNRTDHHSYLANKWGLV